MLPSALYWDLVGSSALLNLPTAPGFGNLGKSFLIDNLLRAGAPPSPAQLRPLPASPVPLKLCPTAEQISPSGGLYPTRWAFQVLNPTAADSGRLQARAPAADRGSVFPPAATGERRPLRTSCRGGEGTEGLRPALWHGEKGGRERRGRSLPPSRSDDPGGGGTPCPTGCRTTGAKILPCRRRRDLEKRPLDRLGGGSRTVGLNCAGRRTYSVVSVAKPCAGHDKCF